MAAPAVAGYFMRAHRAAQASLAGDTTAA